MAAIPKEETVRAVEDWTKPPFLRRVRIRGYKSIAFCDVTLEPLTILVGRNASGKSNFLDALAFVRDLMEMRASEAVYERKSWHAIHSRSSLSPFIEMGLEVTFESSKSTWDADYSFSLEIVKQNQIRVRQENLLLNQQGCDWHCGYCATEGKLDWIGEEHFVEEASWRGLDGLRDPTADKLLKPQLFGRRLSDRLLLSIIGTPPFLNFAEGLRAAGVYNFAPLEMRAHQPIAASPILLRDGSNLARAIEGLLEIEPETVQRITSYLKAIVPGVAGFHTVEYGDFETVRFTLAAKAGQAPLEFDASSMSDGTLRVLAALVAAFQIVLPGGFPGFIGIEEPETALHPAALRALVAALDEATLRTQVLLTTHSPDLLDVAAVKPANVRVVECLEGATAITPVDVASISIVRDRLGTLGSLERDRQLELDLNDLDRQANLARQERKSP